MQQGDLKGEYSWPVKALLVYGNQFPNHRGRWWVHSQLRKLFHAVVNQEVVVTRRGVQWSINPSDHPATNVFWLGIGDYWEVYHLRRLLKTDSVIFDIGANFGYYGISLATQLRAQCKVYA